MGWSDGFSDRGGGGDYGFGGGGSGSNSFGGDYGFGGGGGVSDSFGGGDYGFGGGGGMGEGGGRGGGGGRGNSFGGYNEFGGGYSNINGGYGPEDYDGGFSTRSMGYNDRSDFNSQAQQQAWDQPATFPSLFFDDQRDLAEKAKKLGYFSGSPEEVHTTRQLMSGISADAPYNTKRSAVDFYKNEKWSAGQFGANDYLSHLGGMLGKYVSGKVGNTVGSMLGAKAGSALGLTGTAAGVAPLVGGMALGYGAKHVFDRVMTAHKFDTLQNQALGLPAKAQNFDFQHGPSDGGDGNERYGLMDFLPEVNTVDAEQPATSEGRSDGRTGEWLAKARAKRIQQSRL